MVPTSFSIRKGTPWVVRLFLDHNADVNIRSNTGSTALQRAAAEGHVEIARMLLECHADVNSRTDRGSTPLLFASQFGTPDILQLLLDHNADTDGGVKNGETALHCAAYGGQLSVTTPAQRGRPIHGAKMDQPRCT